MTLLLFTVTVILATWSLSSRTADRIASLLIAIALTLAAGLRQGGYDFDEHLRMIENVRQSGLNDVDFVRRLQLAKDPMFILVSDIVTPFSGDATWPVLLAFAFLAVITKYIAALSLPRYSAIFLAIYLIFLSPTLEFSGIRSAVGIGILMMCIAYPLRLRVMFPLLGVAVASHVMMAFSASVCLLPNLVRSRWALVALTVFSAIAGFFAAGLLDQMQRGQAYVGKTGTFFALSFPIVSITLFFVQLWANDSGKDKIKDKINLIIALTMGLSMGLTLPSIGVSWRILEIGLCLLLFANIRCLANSRSKRNKTLAILVLLGFIVFEGLHHLYTGNWLAITIV